MLTGAWSGNDRGPTLRSRLREERSIHAGFMKDAKKKKTVLAAIDRKATYERGMGGFSFLFFLSEWRKMGGFNEVLYIEENFGFFFGFERNL